MSKYEIVQVKLFMFMSKRFRVTILFGSVVRHKSFTQLHMLLCVKQLVLLKIMYFSNNNKFIRNQPQYRNIYKDKQ